MSFGASIAAAKMDEINTRITARLDEISSSTGIDFSNVFRGAVSEAVSAELEREEAVGKVKPNGGSTAEQLALLQALLGNYGSSPIFEGSLTSTSAMDSVRQMVNAYSLQQLQKATEKSVATAKAAHSPYDDWIVSLSTEYGVNADLVRAVIRAESGFNPTAVSPAGAMGLMQLMPDTVKSLGVNNPFDPKENIEGGIRCLLGHIMKYDGDVKMALAAYNCGQGTLSSRKITDLDDPDQYARLPAETRAYIAKVSAYLDEYGSGGLLDRNFFDK